MKFREYVSLAHAARTNSFNAPLKGTVESDTTYVGGKEKNKHAADRKGGTQGGAGKEIVLGIIERDGELRTKHVPNSTARVIQGEVRGNVAPGSAVMTDEDRAYIGLSGTYFHHTVNHSQGEYVRHQTIHTNSIEAVWALLKRQIVGIHHWVSPKHLNKYVDEMTWRYNRREMTVGPRMNDLFTCVEGRLRYKELIS
ncbi:IS1595 family transposase [Mesorhizobium sp. M0025]|uniref:IS1595 family transposase n=1 Tax=unclassified Mesorhizobium TaxID=325217 RepID=UPI00333D458A